MTCIVGIGDPESGITYIGGDTAVSNSNAGTVATISGSKVFERMSWVIGSTGSVRLSNFLRRNCPMPKTKPKELSLSDHITDWIPELREAMREHGILELDNNREKSGVGVFMIGQKGHLVVVSYDFGVVELAHHYDAIGSGQSYAEGVLIYLDQYGGKMKPKTRILRALEAAAIGTAFVRPPFTVVQA